ncbi:MAG: hypothetical protein WBE26_01085, partial [Phycisphaerae bacterium]
TQLLDGRTNMTVRTISDVFTALDRAVRFQEGPLSATVNTTPMLSLDVKAAWKQAVPWRGSVVSIGARDAILEKLAS